MIAILVESRILAHKGEVVHGLRMEVSQCSNLLTPRNLVVVEEDKRRILREAVLAPYAVMAERCRRSMYYFMHQFWSVVSNDEPKWNWHIEYLCEELSRLAARVAGKLPRDHDLIINVPPGSTKSITCTIMFPAWCWTRWSWMSFICASYSAQLSLEHAEKCRDIIRSDRYRELFPHLDIKQDKDTKSNYRIVERLSDGSVKVGGSRFSTSVGGTVTGFHGHILIVDDPLNPREAASEVQLATVNRWMDQTLSTRKVDKDITPTVLIMQRLHQDDPTGHWLAQPGNKVFHICLPGEIRNFARMVRPVELVDKYINGLLDPVRLSESALEDLETKGQYFYAGQIGQNPVPPAGGMFRVDHIQIIDFAPPPEEFTQIVRYWDKASTRGGYGARTSGVKIGRLRNGKFVVLDCKKGRWDTDEREDIMRETAEADGVHVRIYVEQEPGSGGKDSAIASIRNLAGFAAYADRPTGDKTLRADPWSVQVNNGNVMLLRGEWTKDFIEEHRFFPHSTTKDQVDAAAGAFNILAAKRLVRRLN